MIRKVRLMTPGPTEVPAEILLEMAQPVDHHRTAQYQALLSEVTELLQDVLFTKSPVLSITGSGTAGMEGAIVTCCNPARKVLCCRGGKFGERWAEVCEAFGIAHVDYDIEWGHGADPGAIARHLDDDPEIGAVVVVHSETSTGAISDVEAIARITRDRDVLLLVDAITSGGCLPLKMDAWGIDAVGVGSQKALMLPPGLAFVAVGERAWKAAEAFTPSAYYLDLKAYRKSLAKSDAPYTPANTLMRGALMALRHIKEVGIEAIWARTAMLAAATRAACEALGLKPYAASPSDSVTAVWVPDGVDEAALRKQMRSDFGIQIAGGQGDLKGRIIRFSHMGYTDVIDTAGAIAALELVLHKLGHTLTLGAGLAAFQQEIAIRRG